MNLDLAEAPPEGYVIRRGQILISEQQKLVVHKSREDSRVKVVIGRLREIHADQLGAEGWAKGADFEMRGWHLLSLACVWLRL
jgi:hypothetical protein